MQVIVKPGVLVFTGVFISRRGSSPPPSVGQPSLSGGAPGAADDKVTDPGELDEKNMMATWNRDTTQARDWLFLGPLISGENIADKSNNEDVQAKMARIINKAYLPNEAKYAAREGASFLLFGKNYAWRKIRGSAFDFKEIFTSPQTPVNSLKNVVVYGVTQIQSAKAQTKTLRFRSDDGAIVWLNSKQVYKNTTIRGVKIEDKIALPLKAGQNSLLVKVGQGDGGWGMMVQFEDLSGVQ